MRYSLVITILLIVIIPQPLIAAGTESQSRIQPSLEDYRYQRDLYVFLTGNYLSLPEFRDDFSDASIRNKALILRRLSDIRMRGKGDYSAFSEPLSVDTPFQISLLGASFETKEYEETLALSKIFDSGAARYFEGMSLLRLDRLGEARAALLKVPADDIFYPFARITLAQTAIMDKNLSKAEWYLKDILLHPSAKREGIGDRVHLLLGQLLFERGLYTGAIDEFSKVPFDSPLFGEAVIGQAWGMVRLNDCKRAIPILAGMNLYPPYDAVRKDALTILGYCYIETGMRSDARGHYQELLDSIADTEERLGEMIRDKTTAQRYAALLLKGESSSLTDEERHYLSTFKDVPALSALLSEYRALQILKKGFLEKEKEVEEKDAYIGNKINGLMELLTKIEGDVNQPKSILREIRERERQPLPRSIAVEERFGTGMSYYANMLCNYWEQALGRKVSSETRRLVFFIMLDWYRAGSPECSTPLFICHITNFTITFLPYQWSSTAEVRETPEQIREIAGIIEAIGNDLTNTRQGKKTRFELMLPGIREKVSVKTEEDRKALKKLQKIREKANNNLLEAEKGLEKTVAGVEKYITERFVKDRYELADFKAGITAGLDVPKR